MYIVIYQEYYTIDHLNGEWDTLEKKFKGKNAEKESREWIKSNRKKWNIRNFRLVKEIPI